MLDTKSYQRDPSEIRRHLDYLMKAIERKTKGHPNLSECRQYLEMANQDWCDNNLTGCIHSITMCIDHITVYDSVA